MRERREPEVGRPKGSPLGFLPVLRKRRDYADLSRNQGDEERNAGGHRQAQRKKAPKLTQGSGQA